MTFSVYVYVRGN